MAHVDRLAVVSSRAELGRDVRIGPFCVVEADVAIGDGCVLESHVVVRSGTRLGPQSRVCEHAVLGGSPQHLKAGPRQGRLEIGGGNTIREHVTIHRGLAEGTATRIGERNLIMVGAHIGHDSVVGDGTIIANNAMLGGHVEIESAAYLSGAVGVHQFCRVGRHAMVGGQAHIVQDVPPYVTVDGLSSRLVGLNRVGLQRSGFGESDLRQLKAAYRLIFRSGLAWNEILQRLAAEYPQGPAAEFHRFLSQARRGIVHERRAPRSSATLAVRRPEEPAESEAGRPTMRKAG